MKRFVDVIVPLPVANTYTYSVPENISQEIFPGSRIVVQFGQKKKYTAIVTKVHTNEPEGYTVKDFEELLDDSPILTGTQIKLWQWIADYYLCTLGEVCKAALPSGLKPESETVVTLNEDFDNAVSLSPKEQQIIDIIANEKECSVSKIESETKTSNILPAIRKLMEAGLICVKEEIKKRFRPKTETFVSLSGKYGDRTAMEGLFNSLSRAQKQLAVLMKYVELSGMYSPSPRKVKKSELIEASKVSPAVLAALVDKGIFQIEKVETERLLRQNRESGPANSLNPIQQNAYNEIENVFEKKNVCLLHGVTSSGKTEIYISLIQKYLNEGKQVLYLLPEIALTTQITSRLEKVFGDSLIVYHSKLSDTERVEIWKKQLGDKPYKLILGVRSSVFLPFRELGLVVVDEEHENTFKQFDPAPRYNARDTSIILATMFKAKVLLGTATPSIESYYNATQGKYGLVSITERYKDIKLPEIIPVDIKEARRRKMMTNQFSPLLMDKIKAALDNHEQIILFQNRRGYAPMIECRTCGWVPRCIHCDVSLTYHKETQQMTCHYCGYTTAIPRCCPACNDTELRNRGFGTELVEDSIKDIFPKARVSRLDMDTTKSKTAYENIIRDFSEGKTDILVGTQMISKGLDFDNVSVVGILNADNMLNFPDFRSYERSFQLMAQVAGRAGRKNTRGTVILQTYSPDNPIIQKVINNDYNGMFEQEMAERKQFRYPPFYRLINVYVRHKSNEVAEAVANDMAARMKRIFGERILGPDKPPVSRIQTFYIRKIILKIENGLDMKYVKQQLRDIYKQMTEEKKYKSFILHYDVDPM